MKINIRTRLLLYFLSLTILPLFILATTSTLILKSSIDGRLVQNLNTKSSMYWKSYNETIVKVKNKINTIIFQIALLVSFAGMMLGFIFSRTVTKPISDVANAAKSIEEGDYSKRIEVDTDDELSYLAKSFNSMAVVLKKRRDLELQRDDFVATLTHDLRVPLMASVQTTEYLLKGSYDELTEKQKYIVEHLRNNSQSLLNMVNTILDSYKYEAGKHTLVKKSINLNKLIDECMSEINLLAQEKSHKLSFNAPEIEITADRQELKRVIINILGNAIIYTPPQGNIVIFAEKVDNNTIVSISDNGLGISETSLEKIFERYSKSAKNLRKIGTGLGLYLSKCIVEAHGGKIWVESQENKGSTFYFSIPEFVESGVENNG